MLKVIRRTLASVVFLLITLLFVDFSGTVAEWFGWLPMLQFIPAVLALHVVIVVALLVLTLIFGRIYCSVICPLGILQDLVSHCHVALHNRFAKRKHKFGFQRELPGLRWVLFCTFCILSAFGTISIASFIEPYSAFGRIAANVLEPLWGWGNNLLAAAAEKADSYAFYSTEVWVKGGVSLLVSVVTLVVIVAFALTGRTYCNTICPVGTILGVLSRFSLFRIEIDHDKCNHCGSCGRHCKAHCLDSKNSQVDLSRCVACGNCLEHCSQHALHYRLRSKTKKTAACDVVENAETQPDTSRRAFLLSAAAVTAGAVLAQESKKVDGGLTAIEDKQIPTRKNRLVPAGSQSAAHLYQHCTACQLCIANCPNDVLRPSTDLDHLMQPVMSYERGYCRPECTRCAELCPTAAIRLIDRAEKSSIKIGTAHIVSENCLTAEGIHCGNCARHCPAGAITMVNFDKDNPESVAFPKVDPERCIGCGACENLCPVRPISAIIVDGIEQHRTL